MVGKHEKIDHLENICLDWKIIGALVLKEQEETMWALCVRTERHLWTQVHEMWEIFTSPHEVTYLFSSSFSHSIHSCVLFKVPDLVSQM